LPISVSSNKANPRAVGLPLGVVDAIVGHTSGVMQFSGEANREHHPNGPAANAVAGAAEWIVDVERHARQTPAWLPRSAE
jgi:hypothetical protein